MPRRRVRVKTLLRRAYTVVGTVVLATVASAQTLPVPTLPPEEPPDAPAPGEEPPATDDGGPATSGPPPWVYMLGVGFGYDSNINFRVADGPSSWALSPRGSLARVFRNPRGELRLVGTGRWYRYYQEQDLNRYDASFGLDGIYRPSLSTTWRAHASYHLGYSDQSAILSDQGVLLPLVKTWTVAGGLGFTRTLGLQTTLRLDGRFHHIKFDQQDADVPGLANGESLRGTASLRRKLGLRNSASIEYSLEAALPRQSPGSVEGAGGQYYLTHFGSLVWDHELSRRDALLLEAGTSYTPEPQQAGLGRRWYFYGGAGYSRGVGRSNLLLFARREVTPAFGLGVSRVMNRFGLRANIPMGRVWTLGASGLFLVPETPEGVASAYGTSGDASVSLGRRLGRHIAVSTEGRYRYRGARGAFPAMDSYQVGVFLSLVGR
jgi:hypothetical protein